jgi:hypothetical protein
MMLKGDATFGAAPSPFGDTCIEMEGLQMRKRMGIGEQDPEVGAEDIVCRAAVLCEHQIPSNVDECRRNVARREVVSPKFDEEHDITQE